MANPWIIGPLEITIRLLLALLLGGLVGLEREQKNHPAGLRTHLLVSLGSCLIMLLSIYGFSSFVNEYNVRVDPARLATAVITGVGFLGAGTILFTGSAITGLTTAASIWVTAAIGLAVGAGFFYASVVTTILVFLILWLVNIIEKRLFENKSVKRLKITGVDGLLRLSDLASLLSERSVVVRNIALEHNAGQSEESKTVTLTLSVMLPKRDQNLLTLAEELHKLPGIQSVQTD